MILRTGPSPSRGKPWPSSVPIRNLPPGSAIIPSRVASFVPTSFGGRPEDCSETCLVGTQQEGVIPSRGVRPMLSPSPVLIGRKIPPVFSYIYRLPIHGVGPGSRCCCRPSNPPERSGPGPGSCSVRDLGGCAGSECVTGRSRADLIVQQSGPYEK
jgi:hypothetical protein